MITLTKIDGLTLPTIRERGVPRGEPLPPNPAPAATAMLRALDPGNEALIDSALFALGVALAKVNAGSGEPVCRMTPEQARLFRAAEKRYRVELPKLTRAEMTALCEELGGERAS